MARRPKTIAPSPKSRLNARHQGRRMGRKPPPENETKAERFRRIGTARMNNAIRQIQLLGNLCSPNYECEPHDLALIRAAIIRELDMALARFTPRKRPSAKGFSFDQELAPSLSPEHEKP